jgi:hypothetical protein
MCSSKQKRYSLSVISKVNGDRQKVDDVKGVEKVKEKAISKADELNGDCNVFVYAANGGRTHEGSVYRGDLSLEEV